MLFLRQVKSSVGAMLVFVFLVFLITTIGEIVEANGGGGGLVFSLIKLEWPPGEKEKLYRQLNSGHHTAIHTTPNGGGVGDNLFKVIFIATNEHGQHENGVAHMLRLFYGNISFKLAPVSTIAAEYPEWKGEGDSSHPQIAYHLVEVYINIELPAAPAVGSTSLTKEAVFNAMLRHLILELQELQELQEAQGLEAAAGVYTTHGDHEGIVAAGQLAALGGEITPSGTIAVFDFGNHKLVKQEEDE